MKPWLSALVPVHEGAQFLGATLEAAAQEAPDGVEFLIYDSGVDEGACKDIVDSFSQQLDLRYRHTGNNRAWTAKTNLAAQEAQADHLVMLHQDDLWLTGHLHAVRAAIARAPEAALSIGPSMFIDETGRTIGEWRLPFSPGLHDGCNVLETLIVQNTIGIPSGVIRRSAWDLAGGLDETLWYTADWDLYLKLASAGPIDVRREASTAFRIHGQSQTMKGRHDAAAFEEQHNIVLERHLPLLCSAARSKQAKLANTSAAINCALARATGGERRALVSALSALASLGPANLVAFLAASRLLDRVAPRLRLAMTSSFTRAC